MLVTINRMDKMLALRCALKLAGLLRGSTTYGVALALSTQLRIQEELSNCDSCGSSSGEDSDGSDDIRSASTAIQDEFAALDDIGPESGPRLASSVTLSATRGTSMPVHFS